MVSVSVSVSVSLWIYTHKHPRTQTQYCTLCSHVLCTHILHVCIFKLNSPNHQQMHTMQDSPSSEYARVQCVLHVCLSCMSNVGKHFHVCLMRKTCNNHKLRQQGGLTYGWGSVVRPRLQEKVSELAAQKRSLQTYQTQALELVVAHIEAQVDALDLMAR